MKGLSLCFVLLLVAVCGVQSASYYYRAGREVILPVAESIREVPVDNAAIPIGSLEIVPVDSVKGETVAETVKNVAAEAVRAQNEEIIANEVKPIEKVVETVPVVAEEVKTVEAPVAKAVEVPEVKIAEVPEVKVVEVPQVKVVEVPELKSVEVPEVKSVEVPEVKSVEVPEVKSVEVPEVKSVEVPEVKSNVVVDEVKIVENVPVVENNELKVVPAVVVDQEVVVKETPVVGVKEEVPVEKSVPEVVDVVKQSPVVNDVAPEIRQQQAPNPIETIQHAIQNIQTQFSQTLSAIPIVNQFVRPQSDAVAESPAAELPSTSAAEPSPTPAIETQAAAQPSTSAPNFIQNAINSITSILQRSTTTLAPATEASPAIVSGTRGGEESVEVVQYIDVDGKVDVAKKVVV